MDTTTREEPPPSTISGTVMQLGAHHRVAFYMRDGRAWIAEFHGDRADLSDATTWMRVVPAALSSHGLRSAALATVTDLTPDLAERIAALHRRADQGRRTAEASGAGAVARRVLARLVASFRRSMAPRLDRS